MVQAECVILLIITLLQALATVTHVYDTVRLMIQITTFPVFPLCFSATADYSYSYM